MTYFITWRFKEINRDKILKEGWVGDNHIWNQGKCQQGNKMKRGKTKRTCLMDKMNSGSQENDLLMVSAKVDILNTVFDEHDSYYSLPSTSLQHCYCVPPLCNFKHFFLIPVHMKIHMHICAYEHTRLVKFTTFHLIKIYLEEKIKKKNNNNKEKKWKNLLGQKCLELWEVGDSWGEWSRRALRRLVSVLEAMPLKLLFLREVWNSCIVECIFMLYNIWGLTHTVKNS